MGNLASSGSALVVCQECLGGGLIVPGVTVPFSSLDDARMLEGLYIAARRPRL